MKNYPGQRKLLLIGLPISGKYAYPHISCFVEEISPYFKCDHFHFRARNITLKNLRQIMHALMDTIKLVGRMRLKEYDVIIAIDQDAYAIGSLLFRNTPIILWSLDFIGNDNPSYNDFWVRFMRNITVNGLRKNRKVIIQDQHRAETMLRMVKQTSIVCDVYYMPVFLKAINSVTLRGLSDSKPVLMQIGGIGRYRFSDDLLRHYQTNSMYYRLYFHGTVFKEIKEQNEKSTVLPLVSSDRIDSRFLYQMIEYCDIGFIGYRADDSNHQYISMASGQLVEFLRCGKPVVTLGNNELGSFVERNRIGVSISSIDGLINAVHTISTDYKTYSRYSLECFKRNFDSKKYVPSIVNWIIN